MKVTADLSLARVYWTVLGEAEERKETDKALNRTVAVPPPPAQPAADAAPRPGVKFQYDESVAAQDRIEQIIQDLHETSAHGAPRASTLLVDAGTSHAKKR